MDNLKKENDNLKAQIHILEDKLKSKPSAIQVIAFGVSCFALGISTSALIMILN